MEPVSISKAAQVISHCKDFIDLATGEGVETAVVNRSYECDGHPISFAADSQTTQSIGVVFFWILVWLVFIGVVIGAIWLVYYMITWNPKKDVESGSPSSSQLPAAGLIPVVKLPMTELKKSAFIGPANSPSVPN